MHQAIPSVRPTYRPASGRHSPGQAAAGKGWLSWTEPPRLPAGAQQDAC